MIDFIPNLVPDARPDGPETTPEGESFAQVLAEAVAGKQGEEIDQANDQLGVDRSSPEASPDPAEFGRLITGLGAPTSRAETSDASPQTAEVGSETRQDPGPDSGPPPGPVSNAPLPGPPRQLPEALVSEGALPEPTSLEPIVPEPTLLEPTPLESTLLEPTPLEGALQGPSTMAPDLAPSPVVVRETVEPIPPSPSPEAESEPMASPIAGEANPGGYQETTLFLNGRAGAPARPAAGEQPGPDGPETPTSNDALANEAVPGEEPVGVMSHQPVTAPRPQTEKPPLRPNGPQPVRLSGEQPAGRPHSEPPPSPATVASPQPETLQPTVPVLDAGSPPSVADLTRPSRREPAESQVGGPDLVADAAGETAEGHRPEIVHRPSAPAHEAGLSARAGRLAHRIEQWAREVEHRPPPQVLTLRTGEVDGMTIRVALEAGALRITVEGAQPDDLAWLRNATDQLRSRGFDLSGFGSDPDQPAGSWNQEDNPRWRRPRPRTPGRVVRDGLRL